MDAITNISKPLLEQVSISETQKLNTIRSDYNGTVINETVEELEKIGNLKWYTFLSNNSDKITNNGSVDITELIRLLTNDPSQNWYQPIETLSLYLKLLSLNIDEKFNSDTEFIEELQDKPYFSYEILQKMYSEIRDFKEKHDIAHPKERQADQDMFDSLFARYFYTEGKIYSRSIDYFRWYNKPTVGNYIQFNCYLQKTNTTEHVVAKVKNEHKESIDLTQELDVIDTSRDKIITAYPIFECNILSYHQDIPKEHPELNLKDANKELILTPDIEQILTIKQENPIPI